MCKIKDEYNKLNKEFSYAKGYYLYFFAVKFDGNYCIKPGITNQVPHERNKQYILKEHIEQNPDIDSFRILGIQRYKTRKRAVKAENLLKEGFSDHPFVEGQHHNTEQYEFYPAWKAIEKYIKEGMPFCTDHWYRQNIDDTIKDIMIDIKHNIAKSNTARTRSTKSPKSTKYSKKKVNMFSNWRDTFDEILNGVKYEGIGVKTLKILRDISNSKSKKWDSLDELKDTIEESKMRTQERNVVFRALDC